jgi:antirestriction protein
VVGQAANGFAALAAEDSNGDGIVDTNDANWGKLRVWQDLNSDGKTDEGELKTLEELGIAGFHVAKVTIQHNLMQKVLDRVSGQISLKLTALHRAA